MAAEEMCARCGKPAAGYATIGLLRYCHGDTEQPTCYMQQNWDNLKDRLFTLDQIAAEYGRASALSPDEGTWQ